MYVPPITYPSTYNSRMYIQLTFDSHLFSSKSTPSSTDAWRRLFAILISLDEQSADTRTAAALHHPAVGHISGRVRRLRPVPLVRLRGIFAALEGAADAAERFPGTISILQRPLTGIINGHSRLRQGLMLLLQNLPTHNWSDRQINVLLAEAFRLKFTYADAPKHLETKS